MTLRWYTMAATTAGLELVKSRERESSLWTNDSESRLWTNDLKLDESRIFKFTRRPNCCGGQWYHNTRFRKLSVSSKGTVRGSSWTEFILVTVCLRKCDYDNGRKTVLVIDIPWANSRKRMPSMGRVRLSTNLYRGCNRITTEFSGFKGVRIRRVT